MSVGPAPSERFDGMVSCSMNFTRVHAVDGESGHVVAERTVSIRVDGRGFPFRHAHCSLIDFDDEYHGKVPAARQIEAFVERTLIHGPLR